MLTAYYPEGIKQQTWVGRALDLVEPVARDGVAWPTPWQSGRRAEFEVFLPESIGGNVPAGEAFVTAQIALDKAAEGAPVVPAPVRSVRVYKPSAHGTFAVTVPAGGVRQLYAADRQCSYSLIVNQGANDATLAYGRDADALSLPLASAGDGFHELVDGTRSSASVFSPLGTTIIVVQGRHDPELGDDDA